MEEIEVLEPKDLYSKEIPELVGIKEEIDRTRQVIINGVPQISKVFLLHCPKCGRVVYSFDEPELTYNNVKKICNDYSDKLLNVASYCPSCGQKLSYFSGDIIENESK